ncbi:MAG: hypothetical protein ACUVWP_01285, partial [bacterium]
MRESNIKNNNCKKFILNFKKIKKVKLKNFKENYKNCKIKLNGLKLKQLIIKPGIGVYIFYKDNEIEYIGRNSSKCFVERIPSHFDIRKKGWFNQILKNYCEELNNINKDDIIDENLENASNEIIKNYSIQIINF